MSSAYAVSKVKKKVNCPCGHMGTLDPMASGVLPIGIGKTSRLFDYLLDKQKVYLAEFRFGLLTDTLDITGKELETTSIIPSEEDIKNILKDFVGDIDQIPPNYSAKCVDGKRGYQLARSGVDFILQPKKVHIDNIEYLGKISDTDFQFRIYCKGGTYIRSIARDMGYKLNSLCVMSSLVREECGVFNLQNGITIEQLIETENLENYLIAPEDTIFFPTITLNNNQATRLLNGLYDSYNYDDGLYKVFNESEFWGVGEVKESKIKMKSYVR